MIITKKRRDKIRAELEYWGGNLCDISGADILVTDKEGLEIWPRNPNGLKEPHDVDGVFLT